jgi:hypothetical protein
MLILSRILLSYKTLKILKIRDIINSIAYIYSSNNPFSCFVIPKNPAHDFLCVGRRGISSADRSINKPTGIALEAF